MPFFVCQLPVQFLSRIIVGILLLGVYIAARWGRFLERRYFHAAHSYPEMLCYVFSIIALCAMCFEIYRTRHVLKNNKVRVLTLLFTTIFSIIGSVFLFKSLVHLRIEYVHILKYGALSFFFFSSQPARFGVARGISAFIFAAGVGALEESSQRFIPGRIFDFRDLRLNVISAAVGCLYAMLLSSWYKTAQKTE